MHQWCFITKSQLWTKSVLSYCPVHPLIFHLLLLLRVKMGSYRPFRIFQINQTMHWRFLLRTSNSIPFSQYIYHVCLTELNFRLSKKNLVCKKNNSVKIKPSFAIWYLLTWHFNLTAILVCHHMAIIWFSKYLKLFCSQ